MTKQQATKWLTEIGGKCSYSGNQRVLFVKGVAQNRLDSFALPVTFKIKEHKEQI